MSPDRSDSLPMAWGMNPAHKNLISAKANVPQVYVF